MTGNAEKNAGPGDPCDTLAAWRARGADRLDPIRFHFIEALSRRAAAQRGQARRVLDEKLAKLLDAYRQDVDAAGPPPEDATSQRDGTGPLAELLGELAARTRTPGRDAGNADLPATASAYPELALLDYFRDTWSRYSTKRQLKQSQERVPENAGPLNSSLLVHRALSLMREVSPEYLHQFLSYVDALAWMEQATRVDLLADRDGARGGGARKAPRGAAR